MEILGTGHPTIKTPEEGVAVLGHFASEFQQPAPHEGYDRIIQLKHTDYTVPEWTAFEIADVLRNIRDSPTIAHPNFRPTIRGRGRGRGNRGGDGKGTRARITDTNISQPSR